MSNDSLSQPLLTHAVCPHCWTSFDPADVLAIAAHEDLRGDHLAGPDAMLRFLPSRFRVDGTPIDPRGQPAPDLACPHCHLDLPPATLTEESLVISVIGSPSSGKSFYLTALAWQARQQLPRHFQFRFSDADPAANLFLTENERRLFLSDSPDKLTSLKEMILKTQVRGDDLYTQVSYGGHAVVYARPLMFTLRPLPEHPQANNKIDRLVAFYDNAGESFQPGADSPSAPVTRHLARAAFQFFLFDPTMEPRFRKKYGLKEQYEPRNERQENILSEVASRYRKLTGLPGSGRTETPLLVLLTKADVWAKAAGVDLTRVPLGKTSDGRILLDPAAIEKQSKELRKVLDSVCPEFLTTADSYSTRVTFFPVSVLGHSPEAIKEDGRSLAAVRPGKIEPRGVLWPFLYGLRLAQPGLVPSAARKSTPPGGQSLWQKN